MKQLTSFEYKKFREDIIHDFDLSIVFPFYKRYEVFKKVLCHNAKFLQRNGIEVIVSLDDPNEEKLLISLFKVYPFINWKLIVNQSIHPPRNPAKVLNVGIKYSSKKYILVSDPEVLFYNDVVYLLRDFLQHYPNHYALGTVAFADESILNNLHSIHLQNYRFFNYGSIMTERRFFERVMGYDENFKKWGGEDDNIRKRLDMIGISQLIVPFAKSLHIEKEIRLDHRLNRTKEFKPNHLRKIYYPQTPFINNSNWGNDFSKLSYDYNNNKYNKKLCENYLKSFSSYNYKDEAVFRKKYNIILLAQFYNEKKHISGFLNNMGQFFDGIILLDDGSDDKTYDQINHEKVLIKVRKERVDFDDLENRNILLKLSSFINVNWLCFMDIDERFDERFIDFIPILSNDEIDAVSFKFIHLWDNENTYNREIGAEGVFERCRLFRNVKNSLIYTTQGKLHFSLNPNKRRVFKSNILVKHYGNLESNDRNRKYNFYQKEDLYADQKSYEYLLKKSRLGSVSNITLEFLKKLDMFST